MTEKLKTKAYRSFLGLLLFTSLGLLLVGSLSVFAQSGAKRLPSSAKSVTDGTSATLLPDGQWLLLGGRTTSGPIGLAQMYDSVQQTIRTLDTGMEHARAYHTATLLPDGQVLVLGGEGRDGVPVTAAELFDPEKGTFRTVDSLGLIARTRHAATVLADGRLLITGGKDATGTTLSHSELFDPSSRHPEHLDARLATARSSHLVSLLPNHNVLIWGGVDDGGASVTGAELYDTKTQQFIPYTAAAANLAVADLKAVAPPVLMDSEPGNGTTDVGVDALLSLRFSKPLAVASLNTDTVALIGPNGHVPVRVTPTEGNNILDSVDFRE